MEADQLVNCTRMQKPIVKLCCPGCQRAVLAFVWGSQHTMQTLADPETMQSLQWGMDRGYVLQTIDASKEDIDLTGCTCLERLPLFAAKPADQAAA